VEIDTNSQEFKDAVSAAVEEATAGLKTKNSELLGKLKKAQSGQQIDPAEFQAVETERDTLRTQLSDANKALKKAGVELDAANKRAGDTEAAYNRSLVDSALTDALTAAGVTNPVHIKAAKAMHASAASVSVDGDVRTVKAGDKGLRDFITEWAASDEGKHFVTPQHVSGGGAGGNGGSGGGGAETLTQQAMRLKQQQQSR
jgi:phosphopantothenoylcysteine synthetase/decarboxylase